MNESPDAQEILGFQPIVRPPKGSIVTRAFILCDKCGIGISTTGGPRHGALCFSCTKDLINKIADEDFRDAIKGHGW